MSTGLGLNIQTASRPIPLLQKPSPAVFICMIKMTARYSLPPPV